MTKNKLIAAILLTVLIIAICVGIVLLGISIQSGTIDSVENGYAIDENGEVISSEEVTELPARMIFVNPNAYASTPSYRTLNFSITIEPATAYYHEFSPYFSYDGETWTKYSNGAITEFNFAWDNETRILTVQCLEAFENSLYVTVGLANEDLNEAYYSFSKCKLDCLSYPIGVEVKLNDFIFKNGSKYSAPITIYNNYYGDKNACNSSGDFTNWSYQLKYSKGSIVEDEITDVGLYISLNPQFIQYAETTLSFTKPLPSADFKYFLASSSTPYPVERLKMSSNFYENFFGYDSSVMQNINSINRFCNMSVDGAEIFILGFYVMSKNYGILVNENHESTPAKRTFESFLMCKGVYIPVQNIGMPESGSVGY